MTDGRTEETIFTWGAPPLKFGAGALDEIGFDISQYGVKRVLVLTDEKLERLGFAQRVVDSLSRHGIGAGVFGHVHVEPTDNCSTTSTPPSATPVHPQGNSSPCSPCRPRPAPARSRRRCASSTCCR